MIESIYHRFREQAVILGYESLNLSRFGGEPDAIVISRYGDGLKLDNSKFEYRAIVFEFKTSVNYRDLAQLIRYKTVYGPTFLVVTRENSVPYLFRQILSSEGIGLIYFRNGQLALELEACNDPSREVMLGEIMFWYVVSMITHLINLYSSDRRGFTRIYDALRRKMLSSSEIELVKLYGELKNMLCCLKPSLEVLGVCLKVTEDVLKIFDQECLPENFMELVRYINGKLNMVHVIRELRDLVGDPAKLWVRASSGLKYYLGLKHHPINANSLARYIDSIYRRLSILDECGLEK